jgi:hypothetical protein
MDEIEYLVPLFIACVIIVSNFLIFFGNAANNDDIADMIDHADGNKKAEVFLRNFREEKKKRQTKWKIKLQKRECLNAIKAIKQIIKTQETEDKIKEFDDRVGRRATDKSI